MAVATSSDPRTDFWQAFFDRTNKWAYVSQQKAGLLADCACAQAMGESGVWASPLYKDSCNAIGYEYYSLSDWQDGPSTHSKPVSETGGGTVYYADYACIQDCACELADWVHRRAAWFVDVTDVDGYLDTMSQLGYATVPASQYATFDSYYIATDLSAYSADEPGPVQTLAAFVQLAPTTNYGLIFLGCVGVFVILCVAGVFKGFKKLNL